MPDFIMPPLSPLMISLLRHARLQRGLQLHRNPATLRKVCERRFRLCLVCVFASACNLCRCFPGENTSTYTRLNGGKDHSTRGSSGCILLVLKISSSCNSGLKLCCLMIGLTPMIQSFFGSHGNRRRICCTEKRGKRP